MNKLKFFQILSTLTIILNIALLVFFFNKRPKQNHHHKEPKKIIIERLSFNEKQVEHFELLIEEHQPKLKQLNDELKGLKQELFKSLKEKSNTTKEDTLLLQITVIKNEIEKNNFTHFKDIKAICTPEQIPAFNDLTSELSLLFIKQRKKRKKKKK